MNLKKIGISFLLAMLLINIIYIPNTFGFKEILNSGKNFLDASNNTVIDADRLQDANSQVYNILLLCGIGVAVIVGAALGIIFILSSAEGKAKVSEYLIPYVIGCAVIFGSYSIWKIVVDIGNGF